MKPIKVLIISEKYGAGHESAALAISEGLKSVEPQTQVKIINFFERFQPYLSEVSLRLYLKALEITPELWGYFYENERNKGDITTAKRILQLGTSFILREIIHKESPDVLVCTHPFPCCIASRLKRKGLQIPILAAITDFDVHGFWVNEGIDAYIVAHEDIARELYKFNVSSAKVFPIGIPVNPRFDLPHNKAEYKEKLGFPPELPLCLISGGGFNMTKLEADTLRELGNIKASFAIFCGKNTLAKESIEARVRELDIKNLRIYAFIDNMFDFMKAADLLITKAGGLTLAEALAVKLPVVIFQALPGQEVRNARFLIRNGCAKRAKDKGAMLRIAKNLLENPAKLKRLRDNASIIRKDSSARKAAQIILDMVQRP